MLIARAEARQQVYVCSVTLLRILHIFVAGLSVLSLDVSQIRSKFLTCRPITPRGSNAFACAYKRQEHGVGLKDQLLAVENIPSYREKLLSTYAFT